MYIDSFSTFEGPEIFAVHLNYRLLIVEAVLIMADCYVFKQFYKKI